MSLREYRNKRDFTKTPEPQKESLNTRNVFVIHKHAASHLHFDLRLSDGNVLKSWAVPHGIPLTKSKKNFARHVEDHPLDYRFFEGNIPEGEYGGGSVMIYDQGSFTSQDITKGVNQGHLKFELSGKKFKGTFNLIRLKGKDDWIVTADQSTKEITDPLQDRSASSQRLMAEIFLNKKLNLGSIAKTPLSRSYNLFPMLCQTRNEPFDDDDWLYEAKLDGYRAISSIDLGTVEIYSRNGNSLKENFNLIYRELKTFKYNAVFDGEIVMLNDDGVPDFSLLQNADPLDPRLHYYVFDLLYFEGHDLRNLPLIERKKLLLELIPPRRKIRYVVHVLGKGNRFFETVHSHGFEGIVAKKKQSAYHSNSRSAKCLKIKKIPEIDALIVGYSRPKGTREHFGSLALAEEKNQILEYIGLVGTGFDTKTLKDIYDRLRKLPPGDPLSKDKNITWVEPKYYARIKYLEQTSTGQLRHPVFQGINEDRIYASGLKLTKDTHATIRIDQTTLAISNPDKIYFPELAIKKIDLINYYLQNARKILPFLINRPENLHRYPDGIHNEHFYHKDTDFPLSPLDFYKVYSESDNRTLNYSVIKDTAGLIFLINLGCIELNPWLSTIKNINNPDILVFDLDPGDHIEFGKVIKCALIIRDFFRRIKVKTFVKTSGASGLHIFIPLKPDSGYESARLFAELCARMIAPQADFISLERNPELRQDKVYLDFLQNRFGQTIASAYSVRPNEKAGISLPLDWKDLEKNEIPASSIFAPLPASKDWEEFFKTSYSISKMTNRLKKLT